MSQAFWVIMLQGSVDDRICNVFAVVCFNNRVGDSVYRVTEMISISVSHSPYDLIIICEIIPSVKIEMMV